MTYSIVARDADSGEMGVAVQSAIFNVGSQVPWAEAGVGAVVTQSLLRAAHGPSALALMRNGHSAKEAVAALMAGDEWRFARQLGAVDANGVVDAFTGESCIRYAGHQVGEHYAVQANMMAEEGVPQAMGEAFETTSGPLVLRLLAALRGAERAGGDLRGKQSAALKIVGVELPKNRWEGVLYDVRVDDHPEPVTELARLCNRARANHKVGEGFGLAAQGDFEGALRRYHESAAIDPEDAQFRFLFATEIGTTFQRLDLVEALLREYFEDDALRLYFRRSAEMRLRHDEAAREAVEALMEEGT